jgi:hypothetical protein
VMFGELDEQHKQDGRISAARRGVARFRQQCARPGRQDPSAGDGGSLARTGRTDRSNNEGSPGRRPPVGQTNSGARFYRFRLKSRILAIETRPPLVRGGADRSGVLIQVSLHGCGLGRLRLVGFPVRRIHFREPISRRSFHPAAPPRAKHIANHIDSDVSIW